MRLIGLREQFERGKHGVSESAATEVELAILFARAGFSVSFLQESGARTADLECYLGADRLFVEITVIVPTASHQYLVGVTDSEEEDGILEDGHQYNVLLRRLFARITEKAKQLSRYCAPVILAVTIPDKRQWMDRKFPEEKLDLQRLAGSLVTVLPQVPQLSAVLLTLWSVQPQEARSNIRLANVHYVTRSSSDPSLPKVRLLAINSFATYRLNGEHIHMLQKAM